MSCARIVSAWSHAETTGLIIEVGSQETTCTASIDTDFTKLPTLALFPDLLHLHFLIA